MRRLSRETYYAFINIQHEWPTALYHFSVIFLCSYYGKAKGGGMMKGYFIIDLVCLPEIQLKQVLFFRGKLVTNQNY